MSLVRASKRAKHAGRRLDLSAMKEALQDGRIHTAFGLVTDIDADGQHFELDGDDLLIEVEIVPNGSRITARMGVCGGGPSAGIWFIPPVGSEVALLIPDGSLDAGPIIVGVLSSGAVPSGIAVGVTVIANSSKVLVHDGSGGAVPLVKMAAYAAHTHPTGTGPSGPPNNAGASSSYTSILEGK